MPAQTNIDTVPSMPFRLSDCTATLKLKRGFANRQIVKIISNTVTHAQHGTVASLTALRIDRRPCMHFGNFHEAFEEEHPELGEFSTRLFNKFGEFKEHWIHDDLLKGKGCWGCEVNKGMLLYITYVQVPNTLLRGKGLGSWTLNRLLSSELVEPEDIVVCWPSPFPYGQSRSNDQWSEDLEKAISFYRKNHFRRIGRTQFLAYTPKLDHPSRMILAGDDADDSYKWRGVWTNLPCESFLAQEARRLERESLCPLHQKIRFLHGEAIDVAIRTAFTEDAQALRKKNHLGMTPVHVAASSLNKVAIATLLDLGVGDALWDRDNCELMTPLMLCRAKSEDAKENAERSGLTWRGYPEHGLVIEVLLKRAMGELVGTEAEYVRVQKWGCTCESCVGGWLSPRMRCRLQVFAGYIFDSIFDGIGEENYVPRQPMDRELVECDTYLAFLPEMLRQSMYKTFHQGYRFVFGAISQVFADLTPCEAFDSDTFHDAVVTKLEGHGGWANHWLRDSSAINSYFNKGGKIIYALDCLTALVEPEWQEFGDPRDDSPYEYVRAYWTLPQCRNDREIDIVRQNLGLQGDKEWGPYNEEKRFASALIRHDPASDMEFDDSEDEEWTSEDSFDE